VEGEGRGSYEEGGGEETSLGTLLYRGRVEWSARGVAPMRREEPSTSMTASELRFSAI
jgi:hypothetical protein